MSGTAAIWAWLDSNPGWHFAGDICDGLGLEGKARLRNMQKLFRMGAIGTVRVAGKRGAMRYSRGRPARKYQRLVKA